MAVTKFMESGTDATQDLSFWSSSIGTVASATNQSHTGPRSIEASAGAGNSNSWVLRSGVLADAGRRISFYVRWSMLPTSSGPYFVKAMKADGTTTVWIMDLLSTGHLLIAGQGATSGTGTANISANTWYHITISYTITNTSPLDIIFFGNS